MLSSKNVMYLTSTMPDISQLQQDLEDRFQRLRRITGLLKAGISKNDAVLTLCLIEESCEHILEVIDQLDTQNFGE